MDISTVGQLDFINQVTTEAAIFHPCFHRCVTPNYSPEVLLWSDGVLGCAYQLVSGQIHSISQQYVGYPTYIWVIDHFRCLGELPLFFWIFFPLTMPGIQPQVPSGYDSHRRENGPFIDGLPIKNGDFPWLC